MYSPDFFVVFFFSFFFTRAGACSEFNGDVVCSGFTGYDVCSGLQGMVFVPGLRGLDNRGLCYIVCLEFLIRIVEARVLLHVF